MEPITLTPAVAAKFLLHLAGQEKSRSTRQQYCRSAAAFANFAGGRPVTKALVLQYKAALQQRYAARSVNAALAALNCGRHRRNRQYLRTGCSPRYCQL